MPPKRSIHLMMDSDDLRRLQAIARRKDTSVAALIRAAIRKAYLAPPPDRRRIVDAILKMRLPRIYWKSAKKDLVKAHADFS